MGRRRTAEERRGELHEAISRAVARLLADGWELDEVRWMLGVVADDLDAAQAQREADAVVRERSAT